ncbi:MAG TPA: DMT family transporter [Candidatus Limnocylindria bacterium]|nr:DMT family transporter [Candidatus Limnocylindria bacterium]
MDEPIEPTPRRTAAARSPREHALAVAQALLVTFLWSTSWILIKVGLDDLDLAPISFAGLRYALAALILLPFGLRAMRAAHAAEPIGLRLLLRTAVYGLLFVAVAQGAQFAALSVLPATAVSLVLASVPAVVALMALAGRHERATAGQAAGIGLLTFGALLYFGPFDVPAEATLGFVAAGMCVLAAALSSHLGRRLARDATRHLGGPIGLTASSMAVGGVALLVVGVALEGWPRLDGIGWLIVGWLALVNTAFAFTLWNHTLRTLTAVESSVVNNTMTIQIAILAIVFLGELLEPIQLVGLLLAAAGAAIVQLAPMLRRRQPVSR